MAVNSSSPARLIWTKYAYGGEIAKYKEGLIIRQRGKYTVIIPHFSRMYKPKNLKEAKKRIDQQTPLVEKDRARIERISNRFKLTPNKRK